MTKAGSRSGRLLVLGVGVALVTAGCATVSPEEMDGRLADLREEMQQADQENADRIEQVDQRVNSMQNRLNSLERDLRSLREDFDVTVQRMETALRFSTPIHFGFDNAEVRDEDQEFLDRFAGVVSEYYSDATITVEGFTDPAGSEAYNMQLGQRRADAVRTYLVENAGLSGDRVRAVSYGENTQRLIRPNAQGPGEQGWENRRVVIVVDFRPTGGSGPVAATDLTDGYQAGS